MAAANPYYFPINQLPDHILVEIFLQLERLEEKLGKFPYGKNSLLPPVAYVCSRWRQLYFQPVMWRSKVVRLKNVNHLRHQFHFFALLNRMAGEIHNLEIEGRHDKHRFLRLSPTFPSVMNLHFNSDSPARELDLLVELFPAVKSVKFGLSTKLNDGHLLQMASGWSNLRKFDICSYPIADWPKNVTAAGLIQFAQRANHIESFNIGRFPNLTDSDFDEITMALGVGLKSITFGCEQDILSGLAIISLVRNCPNLEQICIRAPLPIGHSKDLAQLKCLKLDWPLGYNLYDCGGLEDLFSRPLSQFRSFKAEGIFNLTDSQLELIANSCPQLECLSLSLSSSRGRMSDSGLAHIINNCWGLLHIKWELLFRSRNPTIPLKLLHKKFPLLTGRSFIGAGAKLPNLSRLQLHKCENIDAEMVRRAFVRSTRLQIKSDLPGPWDLRRF